MGIVSCFFPIEQYQIHVTRIFTTFILFHQKNCTYVYSVLRTINVILSKHVLFRQVLVSFHPYLTEGSASYMNIKEKDHMSFMKYAGEKFIAFVIRDQKLL